MPQINCIKNLHQLLNYDVRKFVVGEMELSNMLPHWVQKANSVKLKNILQKYHDYIKSHVNQMERFIEDEQINYITVTNRIMHAFIEETDYKLSDCVDPAVKDSCMLACIQNINHYKIAAYGTAAAFANTLGKSKTAYLFHEFEINEKQIDERLSQLAEHEINRRSIVSIRYA